MNVDLTNPIFHDEDKAREHLEAQRWPDGPFCPHCGETENFYSHAWQEPSPRPAPLQLLRAGFHGHASARSWSAPISRSPSGCWPSHLMAASKKGISSKQLQRMLGVTYKSAWFMTMRIREAMTRSEGWIRIGGEGKIIESDETFVGGKKKNVHKGKPEPKKHAVHALVERGGKVRAKHVADVTAKTLREEPREAGRSQVRAAHRRQPCEPIDRQGLRGAPHRRPYPRRVRSRMALAQRRRSRASSRLLKRGVYRQLPQRSASSTCSATLTSSRSAGTPARLLASRIPSAPRC